MQDQRTLNTIMSFTPLKKAGEAQDIIGPVLFLASDLSSFITGRIIFAEAGKIHAFTASDRSFDAARA